MLVKICGLTRPEDAAAAVAAGADMAGFIFVPGTRRALDPETAGWIRRLEGIATVGVFRDASLEQVLRARDQLQLDWVQLHGSEPDDFLPVLGANVLRRVPVAGGVDWARVEALAVGCLPLIDPGAGDGLAFDLRLLRGRPAGLRFGLAGGLNPETVADAVRIARPALVDVSSGVESSPGVKDHEKVKTFVAAARDAADG